MQCKLFYDKYAGDHHFNNKITKDVTIEELEDGSYFLRTGETALKWYNEKFTGHFQFPKFLLNSNMYQLNLYDKINEGIETIYAVININSTILENIIKTQKEIPQLLFLKNLCRYHMSYTNSNRLAANTYFNSTSSSNKANENTQFITDKAMVPVDYTFHPRIENQDNISTTLYQYQLCSINWMINREKNKKIIKYNMNEEVIIGNVYFDMYNHTFDLLDNRKALTFYGGGLIDQVGLGKTIQAITTSIKNPCENTAYTRQNDKTHLYSRATLIVCPNQLCKQWEREIGDRVSKDYDPIIYTFLTKRQFDKYTYQDILDADFVIVSNTFLDNKSFTLPWSEKISTLKSFSKAIWTTDNHNQVLKQFTSMGTKLVENPLEALEKTNPFFQLIHWHRIIVDEFHEINTNIKYRHLANLIPYIRASNKWVVTATPFINKNESLYYAFNFLTDYKNTDNKNILTNSNVVDYLSTSCFRRNTKLSVSEEHTIPPIKEEVKWLKFTTTERMMYNAYIANPNNQKFSVYLRQLCCHPQLADETKLALTNCKTLADIEKMMLSHYKKDVDIASLKVKKIHMRIRKVNRRVNKIKKRQVKIMKKKLKKRNNRGNNALNINSDDESESEDESDLDIDSDDLDLVDEILEDGENSDEEDICQVATDSAALNVEIKLLESQGIKMEAVITLNNYKEALVKLNDRLTIATKELNGKTTTFNFFNNVVEKLKTTAAKETSVDKKKKNDLKNATVEELFNISDSDSDSNSDSDQEEEEDKCSICLSEIPEDDVGVTKCGHIFCYECLKISTRKFHKCSYCNMPLTEKEIFVLSYERKKKNMNPAEKKQEDFINEVGTKLANLIFYLRENNNHTIIFSQWDDLLRRVGRILEDNGIKNVFCKGNCYQRDKAIREFNNDDKIKVIMLSSDSAASGTNLTKASQVIFIDPMYGDYKYRKDQEAQAIGRAHRLGQKNTIKVVRLIIKDSIEEEIYWMNFNEDKNKAALKAQEENKSDEE